HAPRAGRSSLELPTPTKALRKAKETARSRQRAGQRHLLEGAATAARPLLAAHSEGQGPRKGGHRSRSGAGRIYLGSRRPGRAGGRERLKAGPGTGAEWSAAEALTEGESSCRPMLLSLTRLATLSPRQLPTDHDCEGEPQLDPRTSD